MVCSSTVLWLASAIARWKRVGGALFRADLVVARIAGLERLEASVRRW